MKTIRKRISRTAETFGTKCRSTIKKLRLPRLSRKQKPRRLFIQVTFVYYYHNMSSRLYNSGKEAETRFYTNFTDLRRLEVTCDEFNGRTKSAFFERY